MDNQTNADELELEAVLRQLKPCVGGLSVEETFYQAGWNAARRTAAPVPRRDVRGFAVGMVCGLACCAAGMMLWMPPVVQEERPVAWGADSSSEDEQVPVSAAADVPKRETDDTADAVTSDGGGLDQLLALMSPGRWIENWENSEQVLLQVDSTERLIRGVRIDDAHRLTRLTGSSVSASVKENADERPADARESLRAFPLTPDAMNEWL